MQNKINPTKSMTYGFMQQSRKVLIKLVEVSLLAVGITACGGGNDAPIDPIEPNPTKPSPLKLELLTGASTVNLEQCEEPMNGPVETARFNRLMRATVYQDAIYLAETGEGCENTVYNQLWVRPGEIGASRILQLSNGTVETTLELGGAVTTMGRPTAVRFPSGFARSAGSPTGVVLSYSAANSDKDFTADMDWMQRYSEWNNQGWKMFPPGLFNFRGDLPGSHDLVAGRTGELPALIDGSGLEAGFVAPHDLEVDVQGLFYLIDDGRIRTIDNDYNVKTLDSVALGITAKIKALDADHQGRIHALTKQAQGQYTWHRLADGSSVNFTVPSPVEGDTLTAETFTIIDDAILISVRESTPYSSSRIFHVSAKGEVTAMTGTQTASTEQDFLDNSAQYLLPAIQHIEYGVDGHLYLVLPQGVLIDRDYSVMSK
ncbi:hypothetical protein E9531_17050 [Lampropedia puyangensis]|uniref:Uncharacterized protein n=1 Tax=Lampropedia puyangensis TaxID=1330072 RepID=A0A4V4GQ14_9BURK|nr:hypothetical protein [Lampropedia puyangensis]THT95545.1 hypothetical protein E9531_17050 [Lampropedia puyangensis]